MAIDAVLFSLAYLLAFIARLEVLGDPYDMVFLVTLPAVILVKLLVFTLNRCYRSIWRYSGVRDLARLMRAVVISSAVVVVIGFLLPHSIALPRSVPFIDAGLTLLLTGGLRMGVRMMHEAAANGAASTGLRLRFFGFRDRGARRVLIIGAGDAGEMIVREMLRSTKMDYQPVAFVDDQPGKRNQSIHGVPVLGSREQIPELVEKLKIQEILIAIPSATGKAVQELVKFCKNTSAGLKILPDISRVVDGTVSLADFRKVEVEDLLGREPVELNLSMISAYLRGKRILVTGAGGSIGSELCRQILKFAPSEIYLLGRGEHSIYEIHQELARSAGFTRLVQVIGDVINKKKLEGVFSMHRPQIVFHAGADKHVPLMEMNPDEAVFNNIIGTKNVLEVSDHFGVERVVCVSTDKAVNPTSVMGCCKRVAELLVQSGMHRNTVPVAVRFGNVLDSRGSVIPLFERQIREGGPITVTHQDIKRYFMTIPEAASLVIQAGALGTGGEIFVLDMGEPVRIWDLAHNMVRLAGLEPGRDVQILETGLRPGEKMDEELTYHIEHQVRTSHRKILCVRNNPVDTDELLEGIEDLRRNALLMHFAGIREGLKRLVPEYQRPAPSEPSVDEAAAELFR
jgi:FlaA1/EpsC-like NDP-sugar epimerase